MHALRRHPRWQLQQGILLALTVLLLLVVAAAVVPVLSAPVDSSDSDDDGHDDGVRVLTSADLFGDPVLAKMVAEALARAQQEAGQATTGNQEQARSRSRVMHTDQGAGTAGTATHQDNRKRRREDEDQATFLRRMEAQVREAIRKAESQVAREQLLRTQQHQQTSPPQQKQQQHAHAHAQQQQRQLHEQMMANNVMFRRRRRGTARPLPTRESILLTRPQTMGAKDREQEREVLLTVQLQEDREAMAQRVGGRREWEGSQQRYELAVRRLPLWFRGPLASVCAPEAVQTLEALSRDGHGQSTRVLGQMQWMGTCVVRDVAGALERLDRAAAWGDPAAQYMLHLAYATGQRGDLTDGLNASDPLVGNAMSHLYMNYAAVNGDTQGILALSMRVLHHTGTPGSCPRAARYWRILGTKVYNMQARSQSARHRHVAPHVLHHTSQRVLRAEYAPSDSGGGVGGAGGAMMQGRAWTPRHGGRWWTVYEGDEEEREREAEEEAGQMWQDEEMMAMQKRLQTGAGNSHSAYEFFRRKAKETGDPALQAQVGFMYLHGMGAPRSTLKALKYFRWAVKNDSAAGYAGLGMLYYHGLSVTQSYRTALHMFNQSAVRGHLDGAYNAAVMLNAGMGIRHPQVAQAMRLLADNAARGHLRSAYLLAKLKTNQVGAMSHVQMQMEGCRHAAMLFKQVADAGPWSALATTALEAWTKGHTLHALQLFVMGADMGQRESQLNAAYVLERGGPELDAVLPQVYGGNLTAWQLAHRYLEMASLQGSVYATVHLGDMYYYGVEGQLERNVTRAFELFQHAYAQHSTHLRRGSHPAERNQNLYVSDALTNVAVMLMLGEYQWQGLRSIAQAERVLDMAIKMRNGTGSSAVQSLLLALSQGLQTMWQRRRTKGWPTVERILRWLRTLRQHRAYHRLASRVAWTPPPVHLLAWLPYAHILSLLMVGRGIWLLAGDDASTGGDGEGGGEGDDA